MKNKKKSMSDIYRQASRIARDLYGSKVHPNGWLMVMRIQEIYLTNIAQHFGFAAWQDFSSKSCESMNDIKEKSRYDDIYLTKVEMKVYAHPFDWRTLKNVKAVSDAIALGWTLHWMGYELVGGCTLEEMKAELSAIAEQEQGLTDR